MTDTKLSKSEEQIINKHVADIFQADLVLIKEFGAKVCALRENPFDKRFLRAEFYQWGREYRKLKPTLPVNTGCIDKRDTELSNNEIAIIEKHLADTFEFDLGLMREFGGKGVYLRFNPFSRNDNPTEHEQWQIGYEKLVDAPRPEKNLTMGKKQLREMGVAPTEASE